MSLSRSSKVLDRVRKAAEASGQLTADRVLVAPGGQQVRVQFRLEFSIGRIDLTDSQDRLLLMVLVSCEEVAAWLAKLGHAMGPGDIAGAYFSQYSGIGTDIAGLENAAASSLQTLAHDARSLLVRVADSVHTPMDLLHLLERGEEWRTEFFRMTAFRALVAGESHAADVASDELERLKVIGVGGPRNLSALESYVLRIRAHIARGSSLDGG